MRLVDIADVFLGRAPPRAAAGEPQVDVQVLTMRDVGVAIVPRDLIETVGLAASPDSDRLLRAGDVAVTSRGRLRAGVANIEHEGVLVGHNMMLIRLRNTLPPQVLAAFLRHPFVEEELLTEMSGAGTPGLSLEALRNLEIKAVSGSCADLLAELVEQTEAYRLELEEGARRLARAATESVFRSLHRGDA